MSLPIPSKVTDLSGRTFGRLTVRALAAVRDGDAYWTCDCACGTVGKEIRGKNLTKKLHPVVSCGCYRADPITRRAARLSMPEADRKAAASGVKIAPPKPAPKPRPPKQKRILPLLPEPTPRLPPTPPHAAPTPSAPPPDPTIPPARPAPSAAPHSFWVAITKDRHQGYHIQLRLHRTSNTPIMQSRRHSSPSDARKEARLIFGERLDWMTGDQAGLHNQPWVLEIAEIEL